MLLKKFREKQLLRKVKKEQKFLMEHVDIMPKSYKKFLASYYPNAKIRKLYLKDLGVEFGENSLQILGL